MSKGKYKHKREHTQQRAEEKSAQANDRLREPIEAKQEWHPTKNTDHEGEYEKETTMGLREAVKKSSFTDWCIAGFTLVLTVVAIWQIFVTGHQLVVMRNDERAWLKFTKQSDVPGADQTTIKLTTSAPRSPRGFAGEAEKV